MSEPTVTLRFPKRLHDSAKIAAMQRKTTLQGFVEQVVEQSIGKAPTPAPDPTGIRIAALPDRSRKIAASFVGVLELAPAFYLRAIEQYVAGMLALFKSIDKKHFK